MRLNELDYDLPEELIAQEPIADRTDARMLVLDRRSGEINHSRFYKLGRHLREGVLLVLNNRQELTGKHIGHAAFDRAQGVDVLGPLGKIDLATALTLPREAFSFATR